MTSVDRFTFDLPRELISQEPAPMRSTSRVLFLERGKDGSEEGIFSQLPQRLRGDEVIVVNDTRVIPARIRCRRKSGGAIEAFLLRHVRAGEWLCWLSPARRIDTGEELETAGPPLRVIEKQGSCWRVELGDLALVEEIGEVPLPPYIQRDPGDPRLGDLDRDRYQTIYANHPGAVAAPTAGLHFDKKLLAEIDAMGIPVVPVT
ncbi:MAG TPA: tRNA preQ1(34) S-adenosylmethionine ribosyltransferase-isomerase QueA, partial [Planctomycetes bacterium]|nr:tRNA preQ1(34) S-adenosylmethionine ribosyltransferase-isomerase QueA [Planctomycetota bacterium]